MERPPHDIGTWRWMRCLRPPAISRCGWFPPALFAIPSRTARRGLGGAAARRADRCSQGMQRRAELARVLATAPSLLLLDEAHVGLDAASRDLVAARVRDRGGGCVAVSHDGERLVVAVRPDG